jgi:hypothetical protein
VDTLTVGWFIACGIGFIGICATLALGVRKSARRGAPAERPQPVRWSHAAQVGASLAVLVAVLVGSPAPWWLVIILSIVGGVVAIGQYLYMGQLQLEREPVPLPPVSRRPSDERLPEDLVRVADALAVPVRGLIALVIVGFGSLVVALFTQDRAATVVAVSAGLLLFLVGLRAVVRPSRPFDITALRKRSGLEFLDSSRRLGGFYMLVGVFWVVLGLVARYANTPS